MFPSFHSPLCACFGKIYMFLHLCQLHCVFSSATSKYKVSTLLGVKRIIQLSFCLRSTRTVWVKLSNAKKEFSNFYQFGRIKSCFIFRSSSCVSSSAGFNLFLNLKAIKRAENQSCITGAFYFHTTWQESNMVSSGLWAIVGEQQQHNTCWVNKERGCFHLWTHTKVIYFYIV